MSLPTGLVTFVFTDIEGSTRLFQRLGDRYRDVLAEHRRLLRAAFDRYGGVEVATEGDGFFVAFSSPSDAVRACLDGQVALGQWAAEGTEVRVRMGIHTGEAEPVEGDYVALAVHQAARVSATGHGGQIVVSETARNAAGVDLGADTTLVPLGRYRLKDFDHPQALFQLEHPELAPSFPALRAMPAAGHNVPAPRTSLVGRVSDVDELVGLTQSVRLVTITGTGGVGKTRMALECALRLAAAFADGVWMVELAPLTEAASVPLAVAAALGVREQPNVPITAALADWLHGKRVLIVLDNCEHLAEGCAELVDALVQQTDTTHFFLTSRRPVGAAGERVWALAPLHEADAAELFIQRVKAGRRDFAATDEDRAAVQEICKAVDHLPLAIELAAARGTTLTPTQILSRLAKRLPLLAGGPRSAPDRHRALQSTISWSYELLATEEQQLLRNLSIFWGGCSLEAAEVVAMADIDSLQVLVDASVVQATGGRFKLLETIREFAFDALARQDDGGTDVARRHAEYFAAKALELGPRARDSSASALAELDAESDNVRAAFDWALDHDRHDLWAMLVSGLWYHWVRRGMTSEGYKRALLAVERSPSPEPELLSLAGELGRFSGDFERAATLKRRSLTEFERIGAPKHKSAANHTDLAETLVQLGHLDEAETHASRGVALRTEVGDAYGVAHAQAAQVQLELARGNNERAAQIAEMTIPVFRDHERWSDLAWACVRAATAYSRAGDRPLAATRLRSALAHGADIGESAVLVTAVEQAAVLAAREGDHETALRLAGAAGAGRRATGYLFETDTGAWAISGAHVAPQRRDQLVAEGAAWDLEDAVQRAMALVEIER